MNELSKYIKIIRKGGLSHASSRNLSLIANSCLFLGYTDLLKKKVDYSYGTIGNIGKRDQAYFLINEDKVGKSFSKTIKNKNLSVIVKRMQKDFVINKKTIEKTSKERDCFQKLAVIIKIFPNILCQIGFYNSVMRYVKDDINRAKKLGKITLIIGKDRDVVANLIYSVIEPLIKNCVNEIGRSFGFDGDLLRYLTLKEFKKFLKEKRISKEKLVELSKIRSGYLYLFHKNEDYITTDKKIISRVYTEFISNESEVKIFKGKTAYPGKVSGRVYKSFHGIKNVKPGYILVTPITRPQDTPFLKKFAAIITNEGGILSHIAVVARELKIPAVMSTKIATKVLKDGDVVEVDANKGIIKILK